MTYAIAKATKELLEKNHEAAVAHLKEVSGNERNAMGLTPDHIKATAEWKQAYHAERLHFKALRNWNHYMTRNFKKEMREERKRG